MAWYVDAFSATRDLVRGAVVDVCLSAPLHFLVGWLPKATLSPQCDSKCPTQFWTREWARGVIWVVSQTLSFDGKI